MHELKINAMSWVLRLPGKKPRRHNADVFGGSDCMYRAFEAFSQLAGGGLLLP